MVDGGMLDGRRARKILGRTPKIDVDRSWEICEILLGFGCRIGWTWITALDIEQHCSTASLWRAGRHSGDNTSLDNC